MSRQAFVYVGPARPFGLPIMHNAIFAAEPEKVFPDLASRFSQHRQFKKLFVPVSELARAQADMKKPGSPLSTWCSQIKRASDDFRAAQAKN